MKSTILLAVKALLTVVFVMAGAMKMIGNPMMVETFDTIGVGQWFRYVTGIIEVVGGILLWVPNRQFIGAGLLFCTMVCAVAAHAIWLGMDTALPAVVLGLLAGYVLLAHKDQQPAR